MAPIQRNVRTPRSRRGRRRTLVRAGVVVLALLALNGAYRSTRAVQAGTRGKAALLQAEAHLTAQNPKLARMQLEEAQRAFRQVRRHLVGLGPVLPLATITPFVRIQVRGVQAFADAGALLSDAGIGLANSATAILEPPDEQLPVSGAIDGLKTVHASLRDGVEKLDAAVTRVASLDGYRLVGPIGEARDDLVARLPRIGARASSAERGLGALIAFAGGSGPRRYLVFSQNPDEVRPTGGFIGTYGVLVAEPKALRLERFEAIDRWLAAHPRAVIPAEEAPSPLRFSFPPSNQTIANVNAVADWRQASQLAAELWRKGGEQPVDGVLSVTPGFLAKVLAVVGPVEVASYGETVAAANVVERFTFYTRQVETQSITNTARKDFVAELAQAVMQQLLSAPASQWDPLARAIGQAFDAREAMVWSTDEQVTAAVGERRWDGTLPATKGDFFYGAEFQYAIKNGRTLRRTYDHQVDMRPDGSAVVTTTLTIANAQPRSPLNDASVIYVTVYGPEGAVLDPASDPPAVLEPPLAGHPAAGWFRGAGPMSKATIKVVWQVPELAQKRKDGSWDLTLHWMRLPDHTGDVLNLSVNLPPGWNWQGARPPATMSLEQDVVATWTLGPYSGTVRP